MRDDQLMHISYPSGEQLLLAPDGTRLSRLPGGAWAVEFEAGSGAWAAALPSVYGVIGGEVHVSPCPGVTLVGHVATGIVTCALPDGGSFLIGGPVGAYVPAGLQAAGATTADSLAAALRTVLAGTASPAAVLSEMAGWQGAAVVSFIDGRAALSGGQPGDNSMPLSFRLGPGCKGVEHWPTPEPLSWVEYPEPPPPPPAPAKLADGEEGDAEEEEEEEEEGEDGERRKKAPPPPPPPPPPIHHTSPVAAGVIPRLFVIFPSGDGYEVLDSSAVDELSRRSAAAGNSNGLLASVQLDTRPLLGAKEPGVVVHSLLSQMAQAPAAPSPLPVGVVALVQRYNPHATELLPALRRASRLDQPDLPRRSTDDSSGTSPFSGGGGGGAPPADTKLWQYMPRVCAYEPPRTRLPPSSPVLAYREVVEHPQLSEAHVEVIRALLAAAEQEEAGKVERHEGAVPLPDQREESHKVAEQEVSDILHHVNRTSLSLSPRGQWSRLFHMTKNASSFLTLFLDVIQAAPELLPVPWELGSVFLLKPPSPPLTCPLSSPLPSSHLLFLNALSCCSGPVHDPRAAQAASGPQRRQWGGRPPPPQPSRGRGGRPEAGCSHRRRPRRGRRREGAASLARQGRPL